MQVELTCFFDFISSIFVIFVMEISINTPALLFPAISLLLLAYTNRFLAIASLVRKLYDDYKIIENRKALLPQLISLRRRLNYIRQMQGFGVFSFLLCVACMYSIYNGWTAIANFIFALSLLFLLVSLFISLLEIWQSTRALESLLSDAEELNDDNFLQKILRFKEDESDEKA
jgi:hypothetical protein